MKQMLFFCAAVLLATLVTAQTQPKIQVLSLEPQKSVELAMGGKGEIIIAATIQKGYHIQANPASEPFLIATKLELEKAEGLVLSEPVYPAGKAYRLKGNPKDFSTYDGKIEIKVPVTAEEKAKPGERKIQGKLRYQACDDRTCLPPQTIPVEAKIQLK